MRARSILLRVAVATSTILAGTIGSGMTAHAAPPGLKITDVTVTEGDAGTSLATFTINYAGPGTSGVTVDYATADATATAGSDYVATNGTAILPSGGCKCTTVSVTINGDTTVEADETFEVNLSNPVGKVINDDQGIGTITNDDQPHATIDDPAVAENGGTLTFTVTLDQTSPTDAMLSYSSAAGTATDGSDYTGVTGTLTILAGQTQGTIDVPVLDDSIYEGDEDLTMNLVAVAGVVVDDAQGNGTITDDDPQPNITVDDPSASENGGPLTFTISLDDPAGVDVNVDYATSDNTATDGADYTGVSGTATILAGNTTTTVDVPLIDDSTYKGDETLNLDLSGAVHGVVSDAQGQGTITEDDPMPTIDVDSPTVGEGDGTVTFTITLDAAAAVDVNVDYATSDLSATDGSDYTGVTGTATVLAGDTSTTVDVPVLDDNIYEGNETFSLDLSNEVNGTLGTAPGTATISDDDPAPDVDIAPAQVDEGDTGTTPLALNVSLSNPSFEDISVDYVTSNGTATAGSDYEAASGTLTILAGDTVGQVEVTLDGDTTYESNEDFTVTLSNLVGTANLTTDHATGTIRNDDKHPSALTLKVGKTHKKIGSRGLLEPASTGNAVTITLAKYRHGTWKTVSTKTVPVKKLADRDSDGLVDAKYGASFPRPRHGRYRFTVSFGGDSNTAATSKAVKFKL
jgi:Calx-beta domain